MKDKFKCFIDELNTLLQKHNAKITIEKYTDYEYDGYDESPVEVKEFHLYIDGEKYSLESIAELE